MRLPRISRLLLIALTILALSHLAACRPAETDEPTESTEPTELIEPTEIVEPRPECLAMDVDLKKVEKETSVDLAVEDRVCFRVDLTEADFLQLEVYQYEIDVTVRLRGPAGQLVADADRILVGPSGPEPLLAIVETTGFHEIEIEANPSKSAPGRITVRIEALRAATEDDRRAENLFADLRNLLAARTRTEDPFQPYLEIMAQAAVADEKVLWAEAAYQLGHAQLRDPEKTAGEALETFSRVVNESSDDAWAWKIAALSAQAYIFVESREPALAVEKIEQALALEEGRGLRHQRAVLYQYLGQARQQQGAAQLAINAYGEARKWLRPWRKQDLARVLHNLGALHRQNLGDPEKALELLEEAILLAQKADPDSLPAMFNQTGAILETLEEPERAAESYRQALAMRQEAGDVCGVANTLVRLALLDQAAGRDKQAAQRAEQARMIVDRETCRGAQIAVRLRLAGLARQRNQPDQAQEDLRATLRHAEDIGDRDAEMIALVELGKLCRDHPHQCDDPLALAERAHGIVDQSRSSLAQEDHRLGFGSRTQPLFDLLIDLQWTGGDRLAALVTSEQARARALLDRLRQADADLGRGVSAPTLELARRRRYALSQKQNELLQKELKGGLSADNRARLEAEVNDLVRKLNEAEAEVASQDPAFFELMRVKPIDLATLHGLVDRNTVLLVYRLGETRSYLWLITRDDVHHFLLPERHLIETEADQVRDLLTSRASSGWLPDGFQRLADQIFPPEIRHHLEGRRLAIVADGTLETVPFAVLPDPTQSHKQPRPLIDGHEIFYLPSASVWAELEARPEIPSGQGLLAMVADPAYSDSWSLGGARREAEEIRKMLPAEQQIVRLGLWATKSSVLEGDLRGYRYIHLAVHGQVHPSQPALSYLDFASLDADNQAIDSRLYAHELYGLDLPAELLVLAACETGLGPKIPGEGLVSGLSRGFFYAGARRVMVSLWQVPDSSTSDLMIHFYQHLFDGLDPAQSLQKAQRALYRQGRHPNSWAGFVLQGP